MSDLDKIKTVNKTKNYDLKVLKAKSNALVAKAIETLEAFMDDEDISLKDKATMGFKIVQNHIVILDKEEKLEFIKLNKQNAVLRNNMLLAKSLNDDGSEYKALVEKDNLEPSLDLGWDFIQQGDTSLN